MEFHYHLLQLNKLYLGDNGIPEISIVRFNHGKMIPGILISSKYSLFGSNG
jgi:hypothetical protein